MADRMHFNRRAERRLGTNMATSNQERMAKLAARIQSQLERSIGKGLNAARIFLTARIKEEVSVPAPKKRSRDALGNVKIRATTRAIPGAPPRKLTGRLRMSVTSRMVTPTIAVFGVKARSDKGFNYPAYHEKKGLGTNSGRHPFMMPTYRKWAKELRMIIKKDIKR